MTFFEELLTRYTSNPHSGITAVVLAAFDGEGGPNIYEKGLGTIPVDQDSTFWGFSCGKLLTTICMLQCVQLGQIGLDDEVGHVLPELKDPQIISGNSDGSIDLVPARNRITVRHLLTHSSGITYDAMSPLLREWRRSRGEEIMAMSGDVIKGHAVPLIFEPGSGWAYGGSVDWAGVLVERLNGGIPLGEYMEHHLFQPLGMRYSCFRLASRPDIRERLIPMMKRSEDGSLEPTEVPYPEDAPDDSGGMGIVTCVSDFTKVLRDLLSDSPRVLKRETVDEMFRPQSPLGSPQHKALVKSKYLHEQLTGDDTGNPDVSFGLGGMLTVGEVPNLPANTMTWNGMPNIGWFVNRDRGLGGMYASQILPSRDEKSSRLLGEFEREMFHRFRTKDPAT